MDENQLQALRQFVTVAGLIVAAAAIWWALSNRNLTSDQQAALVMLTVGTVAIPPIIEQRILGKAA